MVRMKIAKWIICAKKKREIHLKPLRVELEEEITAETLWTPSTGEVTIPTHSYVPNP